MSPTRSFETDSAESRAFYQRRVALLGKVLTIVWGVGNGATTVIYLAMGWWRELFTLANGLSWLALLICFVMWQLCRRGTRSRRFVSWVEIVSMFGSSVAVSLMGRNIAPRALALTAETQGIDLGTLEPATLAMVAGLELEAVLIALMLGLAFGYSVRAALVPSTVWRTTWITILAALPLFVLYVFHWFPVVVDGSLREHIGPFHIITLIINIVIWWTLVIIVCASITRIIHNLRREIREAMQLGQYTLEKELGEGGMGIVYRASHAMMRRPTAVKLLHPEKAGVASLARFEQEVQQTARLSHPNTIRIYDYGRTPDGVFYYAMELLDGASLEDVIERGGPQPPARVLRMMEMVAGGLAEAHALGIIHRDIKPANIFLCRQGGEFDIAKVLDFGLVKIVEEARDANLTHEGVATGTPRYMSPEALAKPNQVDGRSDLYALGAVAYFMLTGVHVFDSPNIVQVCADHLHTDPIPPSERIGRELPGELEAVIMQCLAKKPDERPQTARELRQRLAACSDIPRWRQADARGWWEGHGEAAQFESNADSNVEITRTLAVDPGRTR